MDSENDKTGQIKIFMQTSIIVTYMVSKHTENKFEVL